jgi:adenylate cyclase
VRSPWNDAAVDIEAWEGADLYHPGAPGSEERLALLEYLSARGATLEQMVDAQSRASLPALAGELLLGTESDSTSVEETAERWGLPIERVQRVLLAVGLPAGPDSRFPKDLDALMSAFERGMVVGEDSLLAFARVLGAATTNIAEAAIALFYAELAPRTAGDGTDELVRAHMSEEAVQAYNLVPDVLSALLKVQLTRASRRAVLARAGPAGNEAEPTTPSGPSEVVALGFIDLVGSTAWAAGLNLRDQNVALSRFESVAWSSSVLAGGRVIKMIGDEVFFSAPTVDAACEIGIEVCNAVARDPLLPPARGAIGHGQVFPREGDYFGPLVNLVARLVKVPRAGELAITEDAAAALSPDRWSLTELEPAHLRGLEDPVRVFTVTRIGAKAP